MNSADPYRLTADGTSWSRWHAEFALVYTMPVNGLLKRAIEKGMLPFFVWLKHQGMTCLQHGAAWHCMALQRFYTALCHLQGAQEAWPRILQLWWKCWVASQRSSRLRRRGQPLQKHRYLV